MKRILITDLNNLWMKTLYVCNYDNTEHLFYMLNYARNIYKNNQYDRIIFVLDGTNKAGKDKLSSYKAGRTKHKGAFTHLKTFVAICSKYITIVRNKDAEGDCVTASLALYYKKRGWDVTVFSNDKDFLQLAYLGIKIADKVKNGKAIEFTETEILNKFKNSKKEPLDKLENILKYRVFKGDQSDKIPSAVTGLQDKFIREIINTWEGTTLDKDKLSAIIESITDEKVKTKVAENKDRIIRNYELMNLIREDNTLLEETKILSPKIERKEIQLWQVKDWQVNWGK